MKNIIFISLLSLLIACDNKDMVLPTKQDSFKWENATIYFLLTDRFNNQDTTNDFVHSVQPAPYRGYMGGDIKGITSKIEEGYFDSLGVDAIWMTPLVENIIGHVDEGTGTSYGYHGYWTKDWTSIDKRLGTKEDVRNMVKAAHKSGIRVLMDAVINHTGPVTPEDQQWPNDWVRTSPKCTYTSYATTTACTLVENLPDILTESTKEVSLPLFLIEKWKQEGRDKEEIASLDVFFERTKYPKRPYYYIVKWLTDLIREFGIDGFRVDTAKHTEEEVWKILRAESEKAYAEWKKLNPDELKSDVPFYMVGEVYNYFVSQGRAFDFGDKKVDFFNYGFDALINFDFKSDATKDYHTIFTKYDTIMSGPMKSLSILNYISSHDDGGPFDKERTKAMESATKLLLTQGAVQIYYGDESARSLSVVADGDATLRSFMNWDEQKEANKAEILKHWQKLGRFRKNHVSIGAGRHFLISESPYVFARTYDDNSLKDTVVIALNIQKGQKSIPVSTHFKDGEWVRDYYSGQKAQIANGKLEFNSEFELVLLEKLKTKPSEL